MSGRSFSNRITSPARVSPPSTFVASAIEAGLAQPGGDRLGALGADEDHVVADGRGLTPEALVQRRLLVPELDHPRRHEDPSLGGMSAEHLERGRGAGRVGVVGVVDHDDAGAGIRDRRQPVLGRRDLRQARRDPLDRHPDDVADRGGGEQVGDVVAAEQPGRHLRAPVADHEREAGVTVDERDLLGAHVRIVGRKPVQHRLDVDGCGDLAHARVVAVGDQAAARGQRPRQLGLGVGDRIDRAEPLEVHRSDRGQHPDPRVHELAQLGDVALPVHPHLDHERLVTGLEQLVDRADHAEPAVERRGRDQRAHLLGQDRADTDLGGRLAVAAGDPDHARRDRLELVRGCALEAGVDPALDGGERGVARGERPRGAGHRGDRQRARDCKRQIGAERDREHDAEQQRRGGRGERGREQAPRSLGEHERLDVGAGLGPADADQDGRRERPRDQLDDRRDGGPCDGHERQRGGDEHRRVGDLAAAAQPHEQPRVLVVLELEQMQHPPHPQGIAVPGRDGRGQHTEQAERHGTAAGSRGARKWPAIRLKRWA